MTQLVIVANGIAAIVLFVASGGIGMNLARWRGGRLRHQIGAALATGVPGGVIPLSIAIFNEVAWVLPACAAAAVLAGRGLKRFIRFARGRWWRRTADDVGCEAKPQGMHGQLGDLTITAVDLDTSRPNTFSDLVLGEINVVSPTWQSGVSARAETLVGRFLGGTGRSEGTGDAEFDRRVRVKGPRRRVLALFDSQTRALTLEASKLRIMSLSDDTVSFTRGSWFVRREEVGRAVRLGVALQTRLRDEDRPIPERLLANLADEPLPAVRRQVMACLVEEDEPWRERAIALAARDPDPRVQALGLLANSDELPEALRERLALAAPEGGEVSIPAAGGEVSARS